MTEGWTQSAFEALARVLGARAGLVFAPIRRADAEAGIRRAMARARITDVDHYLALVETGAITLDDLIDELTVRETYFFRDPAHFDLIRREVIPDVLRRRLGGAGLRLWSAGCASGEEAYSLAIVIENAGLAARTSILGTDISRAALIRARAATYGKWSLRGVDAEVVQRYFHHAQGRHRLDERIVERVAFEFLNLACDSYPSPPVWGMDLIICRNVLMYLDPRVIPCIARRLHATLAPDGWLLTGPSDPPLGDEAPFETIVGASGLHYRRAVARGRVFVELRGPLPSSPVTIEPGPSPAPTPPAEPLAEARAAFADGEWDRVARLTSNIAGAEAARLRIRALANSAGSEVAERALAHELELHPLSAELHFLHAILLQDLGRDGEAVHAVKRALYLDASLAIAHFVLGSILGRLGEVEAARRAYRNARVLADRRPPREALALGEGERAGELVLAVAAELARLGTHTQTEASA
jgi:chemotaxis protein methyltransferase CheR